MLTRAEIQRFPKAELHCHLDGSIRPHTLRQIARGQNMEIESNLMELTRKMVGPADGKNLADYLKTFDFVLPYLQTAPALKRAAYDVMEQAEQDGVRYLELRFAPTLSTAGELSVIDAIEAVATGIAEAEAVYQIHGNILVCGMRTDDEAMVEQVFATAADLHDQVAGVDLAGPEAPDFVNQYQAPLNLIVTGQQVGLTLHAGECGCAQNIWDAVQAGSTRIGHGIAAHGNHRLEKLLQQRQICIEGCPTSNVQTRALPTRSAYPLQRWLSQGQRLCINTDNRTVSDTTLTEEYFGLAQTNGLTREQLLQCNLNAVQASFASHELKQQLINEMTMWASN
ncbi:Adenosine deaminase [Fructilactobacillus florum 8D]|uniref:adenosine deaminase n=1 Tax=Fructilactobacillus florum 8D TaxID=1221538 RepID=W9EIF3_9LACO|nr:adenosine deaminase [Fructilactobacillus florum]EKK20599.1 Adenosine deaminase [Fructilactobacillus florum 2F]ETO40795.1 Adenosine deaminase [Fructilactobacillus florum 8D]